ncbi:hypothetical protein [Streptomyces sp. NPDC003717]|uniref:hypothetical protein n=1 Tax=Streptomyces sp. NPDC003717 TaxID=3154276 RepID=UPI0033ACB9E5
MAPLTTFRLRTVAETTACTLLAAMCTYLATTGHPALAALFALGALSYAADVRRRRRAARGGK